MHRLSPIKTVEPVPSSLEAVADWPLTATHEDDGRGISRTGGATRTAIMCFSHECWWFLVLSPLLLFLFCYYVHFKLVASKYWERRNVFQLDPIFLLGSNWKGPFSGSFAFVLEDRYNKWKDEKLVGFWSFVRPSLLVTDLELARRIMIRDFSHFSDRNINVNEEIDPLAGHLLNLSGSRWHNLRTKLTPTFSSGKMKMMFPTMAKHGLELQKFLAEAAEKQETLEICEVFARFTTDIISSCAFGIDSNCIGNPDSEFRKHGKKIFEFNFGLFSRFFVNAFLPRVRDLLRVRSIPKDVSDFFINVVKETMEYREKNGVKRSDFMELLIQLKNKGKLDDVDSENGQSRSVHSDSNEKFTLIQAAAQAFVFFAAGFETSSTALSFALYELALHPEVQATLQEEIDSSLRKSDGEITYESLAGMEYLNYVVQETLRKYPPIPFTGRKCTKEYEIAEMGVKLEKGTRVFISILGIHRDPRYFPDPERFDPGRFSPEEKSKRDNLTFLPFGEGPRNCIGSRFGLLQTKVGLIYVLSEYSVAVSTNTPIPLLFDQRSIFLKSVGGIPLKITKRIHK